MSIWNQTPRGKHWMVHLLLLQQCIMSAGPGLCMLVQYILTNMYSKGNGCCVVFISHLDFSTFPKYIINYFINSWLAHINCIWIMFFSQKEKLFAKMIQWFCLHFVTTDRSVWLAQVNVLLISHSKIVELVLMCDVCVSFKWIKAFLITHVKYFLQYI